MATSTPAPGAAADQAFRHGIAAATIVALVGLAACYWLGLLGLAHLGIAVVLGVPVYLVFAASALSVWLGFDKDATDLRRVTRDRDGVSEQNRHSGRNS